MSKVWVTSDLHLGHQWLAIDIRGFPDVETHDEAVVAGIMETTCARDILWILGDICWREENLSSLLDICDHVQRVHILLGNHDHVLHPMLDAEGPHDLPLTIHGPGKRYKNFMFSHYPIPRSSIYPGMLNVHGHVHRGGFDEHAYDQGPWLNVNCELWNYKPLELEDLRLERAAKGLDKEEVKYYPERSG